MQTKPYNWDAIRARPHIVEPKVTIGQNVYEADDIVSLHTSGALYEDFGIGNCCARTMDVEFYPTNEPARQAACDVAVRIKASVAAWEKYSVRTSYQSTSSDIQKRPGYTSINYEVIMYQSKTLVETQDGAYYAGSGRSHSVFWNVGSDPEEIKSQIMSRISSYPYWIDYFSGQINVRQGVQNISYDAVTGKWTFDYTAITPIEGSIEAIVTSADNNAFPVDAIRGGYWYKRKYSVGDTTEWVQKGTYFISKRETNHTTGTLRLTCYDAMLKAEQPFTEVFPSYANFPEAPGTVVSTIAAAMGVTLDSRNVINSSFLVGYPVDEDGDMTLREMLGRIAVANAGNWVISDANQLRLVPLSTTATPIALGSDCASLEKGIVSDSIENVEILDNNGDIIQKYPALTVSGKTLYAANPDATYLATDMAQAVYNAVHGYVQYGFTAISAIIDPCAELGDRVTVGTTGDTLTSTIANEAISFSYLYTSDIGAPDADEVEDEYPYATMEQRVKREVAGAYSAIKKSAESIEAIVKGIAKPYNESTTYHQYDVVFKDKKYWMCNVQTASVPWDTSEWTEQSSGALSSIIKQTMDSITLGVASSGHSTSISIAAGGVTVNSSQTTIQGAVTCDSVSADKITAGELDANNIILKNEFSIKNQSNNVVAKIGAAQGNDGVSTTLGAVLAGVPQSGETDNNSYFIVTNAGARMQCGQYSLYVTNSGWFKNYNGTVTGLGDAVFG